jgi:hypothetical protein
VSGGDNNLQYVPTILDAITYNRDSCRSLKSTHHSNNIAHSPVVRLGACLPPPCSTSGITAAGEGLWVGCLTIQQRSRLQPSPDVQHQCAIMGLCQAPPHRLHALVSGVDTCTEVYPAKLCKFAYFIRKQMCVDQVKVREITVNYGY